MMKWLRALFTRQGSGNARSSDIGSAERGQTIQHIAEQNLYLREMIRQQEDAGRERADEMKEAMQMAGAGPWLAPNSELRQRESAVHLGMKEGIADLELSLEDIGWRRLLGRSEYEFSRWGIQQIILICRLFRIKNPLIQRGVLISSYYVFGRGVEVTSKDEDADEVLKAFFTDPANRSALGLQALIEHESSLYTDGNIFWALFTAVDDGRCLARTIDAVEIQEIITDPEDSSAARFYRRQWVQKEFNEQTGVTSLETKDGWYLALNYEIPPGLNQINGKPIMLDATGQPIRVYHRKDGGLPKWLFGCPRAYAAIDWARAYKQRLEDYATIVRQLSRFAFDVETKGGAPAIAALKSTLATTLGNDGMSREQNPPTTTGGSFISGPGNKLKAVDASGKTPPPEEGRRLAHMVYMVFGLPETFFSDVSVGTLATATSLDRPTELKFLAHQEAWKEDLEVIGRYVVDSSMRAPKGRMREAEKTKAAEISVDVVFPPILEGDIPSEIDSVVKAMTLGTQEVKGIDERVGVRELLRLIGVEDTETVLLAMYPEGSYDPERGTVEPVTATEAAQREVRDTLVREAIGQLKMAIERLESKEKA